MSKNITVVNSISGHSRVSGGKVNIAAAAPANKPLSNWWQHSGPIHTHGGKLSDKISRICLSSVYFRATKQTCSTSMVHQVPALPPPLVSIKVSFGLMAPLIFDCLLVFLFVFLRFLPEKKEKCCTFGTIIVQFQEIWTHNSTHAFFLHIYAHIYNYIHLYCPLQVREELQHVSTRTAAHLRDTLSH